MNIYPPKPVGNGKATMMALSAALTSQGSSSVGLTSPPTTGTAGTAMTINGTVSPSATAVRVGLSTTNTVAPTSWTNATVTGGTWTVSITPSSAGTYYIWAEQTAATSVQAISAAVTVSSGSFPSTPAILSTIGAGTWSITSPTTNAWAHYAGSNNSIGVTFPYPGGVTGSAAPQVFWVQSPVTSLPTANGTTIIDTAVTNPIVGALTNSGSVDAYINPPPTAGTWYLAVFYNASFGANSTGFVIS